MFATNSLGLVLIQKFLFIISTNMKTKQTKNKGNHIHLELLHTFTITHTKVPISSTVEQSHVNTENSHLRKKNIHLNKQRI